MRELASMQDVEVDHQALRDMRDAFVAAYNRRDLEGMLAQLDPEITFTAMNGEVAFGHDGVREYHNRLSVGPEAPVISTSILAVEADRLTIIYDGKFGVAAGWADTTYQLRDGLNFSARIRWTNCMIKKDGVWKICSFHTSSNIFDNPVLSITRRVGKIKALLAGGAGLLLGMLLRRR